MNSRISKLTLSGYEKLTDQGFAFPVYTKILGGNLRYRALSEMTLNGLHKIAAFEEITTDLSYTELSQELSVTKTIGQNWTDVFLWDGKTFVGTRHKISMALFPYWADIKETHPLTMIDLIQDAKLRVSFGLVDASFYYLKKNFGIEKALNWLEQTYLLGEVTRSIKMGLISRNLRLDFLDSVREVRLVKEANTLNIKLPIVLQRIDNILPSSARLKSAYIQVLRLCPEAEILIDDTRGKYDPVWIDPEFGALTSKYLKPKIKVMGVGGAGLNSINNLIASGLENVEFSVVHSDKEALALSAADNKVYIEGFTKSSEFGSKNVAFQNLDEILDILIDGDLVFLIAGFGGETGTEVLPIIANAIRQLGKLTIAFITTPFDFEGERRAGKAKEGLEYLLPNVDTVVTPRNQNLLMKADENLTMSDAFGLLDKKMKFAIKTISDGLLVPGLINVDHNDVRAVFDDMGYGIFSMGFGSGSARANDAAHNALNKPFSFLSDLAEAKALFLNISGGRDLTLYEVDQAAQLVRGFCQEEVNIIVVSTLDESLNNEVRVSFLATGFVRDPNASEVIHQMVIKRKDSGKAFSEISHKQINKNKGGKIKSSEASSGSTSDVWSTSSESRASGRTFSKGKISDRLPNVSKAKPKKKGSEK